MLERELLRPRMVGINRRVVSFRELHHHHHRHHLRHLPPPSLRPPSTPTPATSAAASQIQDWSRHKLECCKAWTESKQLQRLRLGYQRDARQAEWWWIFDETQLLLAEQLQRDQYCVIPNFLTDDHANALLADFKVRPEVEEIRSRPLGVARATGPSRRVALHVNRSTT